MISLAYYQSSLVVEHLVDTYGEPALWRLLRAYGRGLETDAAFKEAFNADLDERAGSVRRDGSERDTRICARR